MNINLEVVHSISKDLVKQLMDADAKFNYLSNHDSINIFGLIYFNNFEDSNGKQYHIELLNENGKQYGLNINQENVIKFRISL